MYLRSSKWSMNRKRKPIQWFRIILLVILVAIAFYVQKVVIPTIPPAFIPTSTATRDPASYLADAEVAFTSGKLQAAIDAYTAAIKANPNQASVYVSLARVQIYAGKFDDALANAGNAILLDPNNSMAHAVRGWAQFQKGDTAGAETSIQRALELDPNNGVAHAYYAEILGTDYVNGNVSENGIKTAIEESKAAIALAPNTVEAHRARGYILEITDNREQAVEEYKNAIAINANIPDLHIDLGRTYRALGQTDMAIQEYTLANTLNPADPRPSLYASRALSAVGSYPQAVQWAEQAVNAAPTDPYMRGNWGVMLYHNLDWQNAIIQLSLAINGGTTDDGQTISPLSLTGDDILITEFYFTYALTLARNNYCDQALPVAQSILSVVPTDETAVYNAQETIRLCQQSMLTPSPVPATTGTPGATPTSTP
jgi:tetratricopeptide (TPR) repeat protein